MALENSSIDVARGNLIRAYPVFGYIIQGRLEPDKLKSSLERVFEHFPILGARMCRTGKQLMIPDKQVDLFSWTVVNHKQPMAMVFEMPPRSDVISVTRLDTRARANFYVHFESSVVRYPSVADECSPLIEVHVQIFLDKTVIGVSWNHLLTDGGGMAIILSSWTKALKGEPLPEVASSNDPFKAHYDLNPTPPDGVFLPTIGRVIRLAYRTITEVLRYGSPEPRAIFIPNSVLREWKSMSNGVSTNDLITAWLLKAWASVFTKGTVSVYTVMDLRKHIPEIVPKTYLRNASSARASTLKIKDINKLSHLEVAKTIRSFVNYFTPETELNYQSYEFIQGRKGLRMLPNSNHLFTLSSWSRFNFPQMDFGAKTEAFEGFIRLNRDWGNIGSVWQEDGGARICFWMSKRRWNEGTWRNIS